MISKYSVNAVSKLFQRSNLVLVLSLIFFYSHPGFSQTEYKFRLSTLEVVDKDGDSRKDGLELVYILKNGENILELSPDNIARIEAYLYKEKDNETLMTFWQLEDLKEVVFSTIYIYLPFRTGFAYNVYKDEIIPVVLKIKIVFKEAGEIEAEINDRLSFLSY